MTAKSGSKRAVINKTPATTNATVIEAYMDKNTSKYHLKGEVVELTPERYKELKTKGFVK